MKSYFLGYMELFANYNVFKSKIIHINKEKNTYKMFLLQCDLHQT